MFLRATNRFKDGKNHRYWSVVENRRVSGGKTIQKTVLYLGEVNDSQQTQWCHAIEALDGGVKRQISLFPSDRKIPPEISDAVQIQMSRLELLRPRQWGACWLALELWESLELDSFWRGHLVESRKGTDWLKVLKVLTVYRLCDPGSEWKLHRLWFDQTAMGDLLGGDFSLVQKDTLYRCLDRLVPHKEALFSHLQEKWKSLFNAKFDVLLYDLTSTYFESDPPSDENDKRRFGYSRDKRSDCVQVVIALIVTPEGFPLAYEVLAGNTPDKKTLKDFLKKIETQYGKANRVWVMDRGVPTEEVLKEMREATTPVSYLVGTPKGRLTKLEKHFLQLPWKAVRERVDVKLIKSEGELFVLARSQKRIFKERSMRRRRLKIFWNRLRELQSKNLTRDQLLMKIGSAKTSAGRAASLVSIGIPEVLEEKPENRLTFSLNKNKLREIVRKEGHYLLRTNIAEGDPVVLWKHYIQLVEVEEAFRNLKGDLGIRPIFHQTEERIEAHIFVCFLAYCLHVTLKQKAKTVAPGLTPRAIIDQLRAIQMLDVRVPTTDGRSLEMSRFTQPDKTQALLIAQLKLKLPEQPPPKIFAVSTLAH